MKKMMGFLIVFLIFSIVLFGCTSKKDETLRDEKIESKVSIKDKIFKDSDGYEIFNTGTYYLFTTHSKETYITFLNNLDEEVYEIIDIDIESFGNFVTYRNRSLIKIIE